MRAADVAGGDSNLAIASAIFRALPDPAGFVVADVGTAEEALGKAFVVGLVSRHRAPLLPPMTIFPSG